MLKETIFWGMWLLSDAIKSEKGHEDLLCIMTIFFSFFFFFMATPVAYEVPREGTDS